MRVELLWFQDCANHHAARELLRDVMEAKGLGGDFEDVDATDPAVAETLRFPGSPTIRVNDKDVEPGFEDPGDYFPRCRLYPTPSGIKGLPERAWIEDALEAANRL